MVKTIITERAIMAKSQLSEALFIAVGARIRPIDIMIGPVTTGGKKRITFLIPNIFIKPANTRYTRPAANTPAHAYGSISLFEEPSASLGATAAYPPKNAKDEPRNAGTLNLVII